MGDVKQQTLQHFIDERAGQLAIVYLTRQPELAIKQMSADYGLDLLVAILRDGLPTGRVFGVQIKGRDSIEGDMQGHALPSTQQAVETLQEIPFPVCAFLFNMEDDQGYYRWVRCSAQELAQDDLMEKDRWQSLDTQAIAQIVDDVTNWYDNVKSHSAA